jgi:RNA polymerase sigma-54 factor
MALESKLVQRLSQNLLMTPQLQQAIKLLQLGRQEYIEAIENEMLENPLLEEASDTPEYDSELLNNKNLPDIIETVGQEEGGSIRETTVTDWEQYLENFHDLGASRSSQRDDSRTSLEENLSHARSLDEDLLEQFRMLDETEYDSRVIPYLVGNLDSRGYLQITLGEIAEVSGVDYEAVVQSHQTLLLLEPPGVGARDLRECLLVQLDRLGQRGSLEGKIISDHLELLEKRKYSDLMKILGVSEESLRTAIKSIHRLNPFPARQYLEESVKYTVPDVYIQKVGDEYQIILNDDGMPRLRISRNYSELLKGHRDKSIKEYYSDMHKSAIWLLRSIDQRQRTIYKVTESIVRFQRNFLDHGLHYLRPLVLKEVADDISMHESTVSRVTTNKYVQTAQGMFELKFFFTPGLKTDIGEVSSSFVKDRIRRLIEQEDTGSPISDQKIVEILQLEKIEIARRTVAKYRETMGILPSSQRKRLF